MVKLTPVKGTDAGLSGDEQIRIVLRYIINQGGRAEMADLYKAVNAELTSKGKCLSLQGRASLRFFINTVAVKAGYILPYDKKNPGWRITADGRDFAETHAGTTEQVVNVETGKTITVPSNAAQGSAFENWVLHFLRAVYPNYAWYHQGVHKNNERGLDFVGTHVGEPKGEKPRTIGVQVKLHQQHNRPTELEWLKFLAGCFARRTDEAIFITTGTLNSAQRREAQEARVLVIEGKTEIARLSKQHKLLEFRLDAEIDLH